VVIGNPFPAPALTQVSRNHVVHPNTLWHVSEDFDLNVGLPMSRRS
jgi:hypothetical protein